MPDPLGHWPGRWRLADLFTELPLCGAFDEVLAQSLDRMTHGELLARQGGLNRLAWRLPSVESSRG